MPDYAGPLQRLVFSRTLWLIVAWPLVGLAWQAIFARRRIRRAPTSADRTRELASSRTAGIACIALSTVSTLAHAAVLSRTPDGARALFQHVAAGAHVGCLDAPLDLWFDPLSATFCSLACLIALAASVIAATGPDVTQRADGRTVQRAAHVPPPLPERGRPVSKPGWRTWALLQLSLAGALIAFLADGFVGTAMGWMLAGSAAAWLASWEPTSFSPGVVQAVRSAAATGAMLVGAALLFWGLGGAWEGDDYVPDLQPRFTPVRTAASAGADPIPGGGGTLTMTSVPGALVFLDDARTPVARSPVAGLPVPAGTHAIRVRLGDGPTDEVLGRVVFAGGDEIALVPFGPTLAFRAVADQLVVLGPDGEPGARRDMEARAGPGGAAVVASSLLAFLFAAWAMSGGAPLTAGPRALGAVMCGATTGMLGPYLLARLAFLFPLTPHTWAAVESIGAVTLLAGGWYAPSLSGLRRWLAFAGVAPAGLTWLALGAAGVTAATYVAIVVGVATAALYLGAALVPNRPERERAAPRTLDHLLFVRVPARLGALLVGMDRWVVGAIVGSIAALVRAAAWSVATFDAHIVAAPANGVATRIVRMHRSVQPIVGASFGRLAWALLGAAGLAGLAYAFWLGR